MGRWKLNFSLYLRKFPSGKSVWYYRAYSPSGKRMPGISTHQTSKTKAIKYCEELYKRGELFKGETTLFKVYAKDFFNTEGEYMKSRLNARSLSPTYAPKKNQILNDYLMPYFSEIKLNNIDRDSIIGFQNYLRRTRNISEGAVNDYVTCLSLMLDYAVIKGVIAENPVKKVERIEEHGEVRDSFSLEEVKAIVSNEKLKKRSYMCNIVVAALTGMRISETCAIDSECLKDHYIDLQRQYLRKQYSPLKTKHARKIPLCDELYNYIKENINSFKHDSSSLTTVFKRGIVKYVSSYDPKRNICFHSLRHFFNTYMISKGMNNNKVAAVMGHSTGVSSMQDRYTNFKLEDYSEIVEEQRLLFLYLFS